MPKFLVEARDRDYRRIGVVEQYTSLDVIARHCAVGSWKLTVPADYWQNPLQPGGGIVVWVEGLAEPVMSGPIRKISHDWSADAPGRGLLTFSGVSDEHVLWGRVTYPTPNQPISNQGDRASGTHSVGAAMVELVNTNAGPLARGNRVIPGLVVEPSNTGPVIRWTSRYDVLGEKLAELANAYGVAFQVRQGASGEIVFRVYTPRDLSSRAVFSREDGNLESFSYSLAAPVGTRFIAAAQGEMRQRYVKAYREDGNGVEEDPNEATGQYFSPVTEWSNYWPEVFIDRRDIPLAKNASGTVINPDTGNPATADELDVLDDAIAEDAAELAPMASLSISPVDTPQLRFGRDYRLGDTVSVRMEGQTLTDVLREVHLTDGSNGPRVAPIVGSSTASETPNIYRDIKRLWSSLRKLEARR